MIKNYLKMAARSLQKRPAFTAINLLGLAVGLACCLLIFLYVRDEVSYDRFHAHADDIYRVTTLIERSGSGEESGTTSPPLAAALEADLPDVETALRLWSWRVLVQSGTDSFRETVHFADPAFFEVFSFPLRYGRASEALSDPNHIVLTPESAQKYFNRDNPLGETITLQLDDTLKTFTVRGVTEPIPANSSIQFTFLLPFANVAAVRGNDYVTSWGNFALTTFVRLRPDTDPADVEAALPAFSRRHLPGDFPLSFAHLQPLTDLRLDASISGSNGVRPSNSVTYSYILSGMALLILLIACINFTNLTTGQSLGRAREIGVRKAMGAFRRQLMAQFWGEALLSCALALGLGLVLATAFLPTFNALSGKALSLAYLTDWTVPLACVLLVGVAGLVAGSYPALVLSSFHPVDVLRDRLTFSGPGAFSRLLVVVQFALSVFLIASLLVMNAQLNYVQTTDLGYDDEHLVGVEADNGEGTRLLAAYRDRLGTHPDVLHISGSTGAEYNTLAAVRSDTFDTAHDRVAIGYLETLGITLTDGRTFSRQRSTDSTQAVVVNEAFVRRAGLTDPVGQTIEFSYGPIQDPTIIGVVKDYHFRSLHEEIGPLVLHLNPELPIGRIWVKTRPGAAPRVLAEIEDTWREVAPALPFAYQFMQELNAEEYRASERWQQIIGYAALFALLIACMGLLGLSTLVVQHRTKEIGIRKALGASVASILGLLSKDFLRLVIVAFVSAAPIAYVAMQRWLQDFAYRIDLGPGLMALAGTIALSVALLAVSYQSVRAARLDPAESLRYE